MNQRKEKHYLYEKFKTDNNYLLNTIIGEDTADLYDYFMIKRIKLSHENLSDYEKFFVKYWSNKLLYNMIESKELDKEILNYIKNDSI